MLCNGAHAKPLITTADPRWGRLGAPIDEETMQEFQGQQLVNLVGVIAIPLNVTPYNCLELFSFNVRS